MSELGERYGLSQDEGLQLKDYPTLRHVIGYVKERSSGGAPAAPAVSVEVDAADVKAY